MKKIKKLKQKKGRNKLNIAQSPPKRLYVKSISLDNFKSFKENSKINLAPMVNLIFGQNSAGKSSIFQALRLFRQSYYPGGNMSVLNYEAPLQYRGNGGLNIDIGYEGIVNEGSTKKQIDLGVEIGTYNKSEKEVTSDGELKFRFKYLKNFYKAKDLIKNKTIPSKITFSDSKNFVSIDLVSHKFFKEDSEKYQTLLDTGQTYRRLSRRMTASKPEKSPYGAIYDPFLFKAKINKNETRLESINEIYDEFQKIDLEKIYKILSTAFSKIKNQILFDMKRKKNKEPFLTFGQRRERLKDIKKKMFQSFYGKNLTSQQRIDWILKSIKEVEKKNEKEVLEDKGDAVDVLNEEFLDTVFLLNNEKGKIKYIAQLKRMIKFLSKKCSKKEFYNFFLEEIIEENKDLIFFNGDFRTDPTKSKNTMPFFLSSDSENSSNYIVNIFGWLFFNDKGTRFNSGRYVNLLGLYDSSNTTHPVKDAMYGVDTSMKKMVIVPGLRSMPKKYFVKGMQTNYVGAQAENLAELLANPTIKKEANVWLKKLEIPYNVNIQSSGNYYEIVFKPNKSKINIAQTHIGLGYPLVLPLIVQSLISRNKIIVVEEPEVHLHPKIEADLAELIVYSSINYNNQFLIETHSEEFLLRILKNVRDKKIKPNDISINYITNDRLKGKIDGSIVNKVLVKSDGSYKTPWKDDLFAERIKEYI